MVMSRLSFVVLMLAVTLPHGRALTFNVDPAKVLLRFSLHAARLPLSQRAYSAWLARASSPKKLENAAAA